MKSQRLLVLLLAALALFCGCKKSAPAPVPAPTGAAAAPEIDPVYGHLTHAQPRLPAIKVLLGDQELKTEIARRKVEIATGMMFRTNMPEDEAMIFIFDYPTQQSFYMRNCFVALSGAYISPEGEILEIIQMQPHNETGIPSKSHDIQFVLEVPQGWFARHNVGVGAILRTERGTLKQTFFTNR